ncbi:hypothetical protein D3C75_819400 [compost metagenome]
MASADIGDICLSLFSSALAFCRASLLMPALSMRFFSSSTSLWPSSPSPSSF